MKRDNSSSIQIILMLETVSKVLFNHKEHKEGAKYTKLKH
jgi:hypothetical protein